MNVYDTRLVDDWPACGMNWPPDLPDIYDLLRVCITQNHPSCSFHFRSVRYLAESDINQSQDTLTALHATRRETAWTECDGRVSSELYSRRSPAAVGLMPGILESGVQVLIFAGSEDLICNYAGLERMIENLTWNKGVGFGVSFLDTRRCWGSENPRWRLRKADMETERYCEPMVSKRDAGRDVDELEESIICQSTFPAERTVNIGRIANLSPRSLPRLTWFVQSNRACDIRRSRC